MAEQPPLPPYSPLSDSYLPPLPPGPPPRLPPRNGSVSSSTAGWSPSSSRSSSAPYLHPYGDSVTVSTTFLRDPRASSQASLLPADSSARSSRRKLLLVYIHGFMGNETSFQSFPAHLHNLLTVTLDGDGEGYLVHTKVYPKFKTRHQINVATLEFSNWLSEFESENTDIILIGHSMGGILAAEVVLLPSIHPPGARRHSRILGMIAFDTPFLGMHPGIISSGIASLFRPAPLPPPANTPDQGGTSAMGDVDPFFSERPKRNFTLIPSKKPANPWESTLHFISKHHENLTQATGKYLMSHLEFGACLADPIGLKTRYTKIRRLEDGEQMQDGTQGRVRFSNYYTISYGHEKAVVIVKPPLPGSVAQVLAGSNSGSSGINETGIIETGIGATVTQLAAVSGEKISAATKLQVHSRSASVSEEISMQELAPEPISRPVSAQSEYLDTQEYHTALSPTVEIEPPTPISPLVSSSPLLPALGPEVASAPTSSSALAPAPAPAPSPYDDVEASFPPLSAPPVEPALQKIPELADKPLRKALEKENKRLLKEHERQMKEHSKLARGREKAISRVYKEREKGCGDSNSQKEREKERMEREKQKNEEREREKQRVEKENQREQQRQEREKEQQEKQRSRENTKKTKPPRQRKFCILPSQPDSTWIPVEMQGVDEVGAHCGLFFLGDVYAKLVGDVAGRIEEWVGEEQSRRFVEGGGYMDEKRRDMSYEYGGYLDKGQASY